MRPNRYASEADHHRPTDVAMLRKVALELRQQGLQARDIASALRISTEAARAILNEHQQFNGAEPAP